MREMIDVQFNVVVAVLAAGRICTCEFDIIILKSEAASTMVSRAPALSVSDEMY